jgi:hypothetical protein
VAGKLKVLPEQPEHLSVLNKNPSLNVPPKPSGGIVDSTGESEDGDIESSEDSGQEDVDYEACAGPHCSLTIR